MATGRKDAHGEDGRAGGLWVSRWVRRTRRWLDDPFLASAIVFGTVPAMLLVVYAVRRSAYLTPGFSFSLLSVGTVLFLGPYLVWYYDTRLLPGFARRFEDAVVDGAALDAIVERHRQFLSERWWIASGLAAIPIPVLMFGAPGFLRARGLFGPTDPLFWTVMGVLLWLSLFVGMGFLVVLVTILLVRSASSLDLRIDPLHPDGLGGTGAVGYLAIRTTVLFSLGALLLPLTLEYASAAGLGATALVYAMDAAYAIAIAASFLYPTVVVYRRAERVRERELDQLRRRYTAEKRRALDPDIGLLPGTTGAAVELKLQRLRNEYEDYRQVSLYPMKTDIIVRLVGSVLLPLVFLVLDMYLRPEIVERLVGSFPG